MNVANMEELGSDPLRGPTFQNRDQEQIIFDHTQEREPKQTAVFNADMTIATQSLAQMVRENSVVNFQKTSHSFEFVQNKHSDNREAHKEEDSAVHQREQSFHGKSENLVARLNMFYQERDEKDDGLVADQNDPTKKIRTCYLCKNMRMNHVVKH